MKINLDIKKKIASDWFEQLQNEICNEFEKLEMKKSKRKKIKSFKQSIWKKSSDPKEGGGKYFLMRDGEVFDSVGINFSRVSGRFDKKFRLQILGAKKNPNYWASGISVVAHMRNPKIPALHFNTRFIVTSQSWFGGGMDATPTFKDKKERSFFHKEIKKTCDKFSKNYYPKFKKNCDKYFYLPHRKETRGIGGIFFDYKKDNWEKDFNLVRSIGLCFLDCAKIIIENKINTLWSSREKNMQLYKRGRYIEFNLLYDKGTRFGLNTGGNINAILMSLPPTAKWK